MNQENPSYVNLWPELPQDQSPARPFPWPLWQQYLIPGVGGLLILGFIYLILQQHVTHRITFINSDQQLTAMQADGRLASDAFIGISTGNESNQGTALDYQLALPTLSNNQLPLLAWNGPRWSPDGDWLATVIILDGKQQLSLWSANNANKVDLNTASDVVLPAEAWSPSSRFLAVIQFNNEKSLLTIFDIDQKRPTLVERTLDTRAGYNWRPLTTWQKIQPPKQEQLLVTTLEDGEIPRLQLIDTTGAITEFSPNDDQLIRGDGRWSPGGDKIAYIASETKIPTNDLLYGDIWVADATGENARKIITGGKNLAPLWSADGEYVYFLHISTKDDSLTLQRANLAGEEKVTLVGTPTENLFVFPFDRDRFISWSPDQNQFVFMGVNEDTESQLFWSPYPELDVKALMLPSECPLAPFIFSQWAPTSKSLLINCISNTPAIYEKWFTDDRLIAHGEGILPDWEP